MNLLREELPTLKYKSSEKFSELSWKEYDWLRDLVEIIEAVQVQSIIMNLQNFKCSKITYFVLRQRELVIKLPKNATPIDFAYAVHTKVGNSAIGCSINGSQATLQTILKMEIW